MRQRDPSNAPREIRAGAMRDPASVLRVARKITMRDANNVLRVVFQNMTVSASPEQVTGTVSRAASVPPVQTPLTTVTASGGSAPFTYAWATDGTGWTISAPTAATTSFAHAAGPGVYVEADFTCTVTDANGATGQVVVNAAVQNLYYSAS